MALDISDDTASAVYAGHVSHPNSARQSAAASEKVVELYKREDDIPEDGAEQTHFRLRPRQSSDRE